MGSAFPYDAERDIYLCPAGEKLTHHAVSNAKNGVRRHVYRTTADGLAATCVYRDQCASKKPAAGWRRSITRIEEPAATATFKAKMKTEEAQKIYKQRSQIAEFPHAWIKQRVAFGNFDAEEDGKPPWKPLGPVSATTSRAGSAYAANSML